MTQTSSPSWCLFVYARNPTLAKSEIEKYLRDYLGVELVLWLGQGVIGDVDTDGHIDNLLAFVRPGEVSYGLDVDGMKLMPVFLLTESSPVSQTHDAVVADQENLEMLAS